MTAAIEIAGLTKKYGSTRGIEQVDLRVEQGEVFGFLGPNGAGKTTTIRCMVGLLTPTAGSARLLGLDPLAQHGDLGRRLGYLPGELRLYDELTGAQHLELLGALQGTPTPRRAELCERFGLHASALNRPTGGYSRGMKQKVGLVQAFQHDPEIFVLDEPTEGLDPLMQQAFFELLEETRQAGRTVFLSSHVLADVQRVCGRVAIMREGQLIAVQEVEALRELQARKVRLTFSASAHVDPATVPVEQAWSPVWNGPELRLVVPPTELVALLRRLLDFPLTDIVVEESSLDEAFLSFYSAQERA